LGDTVVLCVDHFQKLDLTKTTLFIDGVDSKLAPISIDSARREVGFQLSRNSVNKELWRPILRNPVEHPTRTIRLSVGSAGAELKFVDDKTDPAGAGAANKEKPASEAETTVGPSSVEVNLDKLAGGLPALTFLAIVIAITVLLVYYGRNTDLLRNGPPVGTKRQAFSLGRWQMAWWFYWIVVAYIGIWLVTGDRDTVTAGMLTLMGISGATALGSVLIDASQPNRDSNRRAELQNEKAELTGTRRQLENEAVTQESVNPGAAAAATNAIAAADARVQQINQNIATVTEPPLSQDWLTDVLTDANGAHALHRFQILVWTVVLGVVFIFTAANELTMPDFNPTMLALMSISAGTYLGFKFPGATT
jgi:hypothetical protein